jgi:hypothetical protein
VPGPPPIVPTSPALSFPKWGTIRASRIQLCDPGQPPVPRGHVPPKDRAPASPTLGPFLLHAAHQRGPSAAAAKPAKAAKKRIGDGASWPANSDGESRCRGCGQCKVNGYPLVRFSRASSWTFFMTVCNGLQQISHKSRFVVRHELLATARAVDADVGPSQIVIRFAEAAIADEGRLGSHDRIRPAKGRTGKQKTCRASRCVHPSRTGGSTNRSDVASENMIVISECFRVSALRTSETAVVGFSRFAVKANKSKLARTRRTDRSVISHQRIKKKVVNRAHTASNRLHLVKSERHHNNHQERDLHCPNPMKHCERT